MSTRALFASAVLAITGCGESCGGRAPMPVRVAPAASNHAAPPAPLAGPPAADGGMAIVFHLAARARAADMPQSNRVALTVESLGEKLLVHHHFQFAEVRGRNVALAPQLTRGLPICTSSNMPRTMMGRWPDVTMVLDRDDFDGYALAAYRFTGAGWRESLKEVRGSRDLGVVGAAPWGNSALAVVAPAVPVVTPPKLVALEGKPAHLPVLAPDRWVGAIAALADERWVVLESHASGVALRVTGPNGSADVRAFPGLESCAERPWRRPIAVAAGEAFAVAGCSGVDHLAHFDGVSWRAEPAPPGAVSSLGLQGSTLWATAGKGLHRREPGGQWRTIPLPPEAPYARAVWTDPGGDVWVAADADPKSFEMGESLWTTRAVESAVTFPRSDSQCGAQSERK